MASSADIVWDDKPDIVWDEPEKAPAKLGRGELQVAEGRREITDTARNVPLALLTRDPVTNRKIAENMYEAGHTQPVDLLTGVKATMLAGGLAMAPLAGIPAAAASSGLLGGGLSGGTTPGDVAADTAKSALVGGAISKAVPAVAGAVGRFADRRLGAAAAKATAEQAAARASEVKSAAGTLGAATAENNRVVEAIRGLLTEGNLTEAQRATLEGLKNTPEYAAAVESLTASLSDRLPQVAGRVATGRAAVEAANNLPTVSELTAQRLSPSTAGVKVMDRVKRYWLPIAGGALGYMADGFGGLGIGALAGRGASPTVQALWRMTKDPAVQTQIWTPVSRLAAAMSRAPGAVAVPTAPAVADPVTEALLKVMGRPSFVPVAATEEAPK